MILCVNNPPGWECPSYESYEHVNTFRIMWCTVQEKTLSLVSVSLIRLLISFIRFSTPNPNRDLICRVPESYPSRVLLSMPPFYIYLFIQFPIGRVLWCKLRLKRAFSCGAPGGPTARSTCRRNGINIEQKDNVIKWSSEVKNNKLGWVLLSQYTVHRNAGVFHSPTSCMLSELGKLAGYAAVLQHLLLRYPLSIHRHIDG